MFKKYTFSQIFQSDYFFCLVLVLNIVLLCRTRFYPSLDGPAHLYYTNILNELIKGNCALKEFYSINTVPIPNWTSHFILSFFLFFSGAWLAEKALIIIYVSGMALSFRFLIKELSPENTSLSLFIFPFIYSFLFHLGFYNFCISFILFFTALGFWLRNQSNENHYNYFILFLIIMLAYFSNVLIFGFLGLTIGLYIIYFAYTNYTNNKNLPKALHFGIRNLLLLLLASAPGLIFLFIFNKNVEFFPTNQKYSVTELLQWLNDTRPLIVYQYASEKMITEQFFHIILVLFAIWLFHKMRADDKKHYLNFKKADVFFIPLLVSVVLLFFTPSGSSAGMMSDRYCLIVFIFGLIWIVSHALPGRFNNILVIFILIFHFNLLFKHIDIIKGLNRNTETIYKAAEYINENNIVLPINLSDNWLELHFSDYLGVDKPMIILENYQASIGWFPIKWKCENMPKVILGNKESIPCIRWMTNPKSKNIRKIDNIFLYGKTNKIYNPEWKELNDILISDFKLKYQSENNFIMLYEKVK